MKKYTYIIGSIFLVALVAGVGRAVLQNDTRLRSQMKSLQAQATQKQEEARQTECTLIGRDTNECFSGNKDACKLLQKDSQHYQAFYNVDPIEDCKSPDTSTVATEKNPLFFGDEAGNK